MSIFFRAPTGGFALRGANSPCTMFEYNHWRMLLNAQREYKLSQQHDVLSCLTHREIFGFITRQREVFSESD